MAQDYEKENFQIPWPDWEIVRVIGRGSFGIVYEMRKDVFGIQEEAALKVISIPADPEEADELYEKGYAEDSIQAHFEDCLRETIKEYSVMLELRGCGNIVYCDEIRYSPHSDGLGWDIFIKMELLQPLHKTVSGDYDEASVIAMAKDLCRALLQCRRHNLIHRDLKPQNIFLSKDGTYKLGDFGIAKISDKTSSGTKTGTFEYMAPEVYKNQPYNGSVDIYALGLVMYWMMNDRTLPFMPAYPAIPKFSEKEEACARRMRGEAFPPPKNGSERLCAIMKKAAAYRREDRYTDPQKMLEDLEALDKPSEPETPEDLNIYTDLSCTDTQIRLEKKFTVQVEKGQLEIQVPKDAEDGQMLTLSGMGHRSADGERAGDLRIRLHVARDPQKKKNTGNTLLMIICAVIAIAAIAAGIFRFMNKEEHTPPTVSEPPRKTEPAPTKPKVIPRETEPPVVTRPKDPPVVETAAPTEKQAPKLGIPKPKPGQVISFGSYTYDRTRSPLKWKVLDVRSDAALVITTDGIDSLPYHEFQTEVSWEDCSVRNWLNRSFFYDAFTMEEQEMIVSSQVFADYNPVYNTDPGSSTEDCIFLLSIPEAERYLPTDRDRYAEPTPFAVARGAWKERDGGGWWLLRTPGSSQKMVASTNTDGTIDYDGGSVSSPKGMIRPAMWIRIR